MFNLIGTNFHLPKTKNRSTEKIYSTKKWLNNEKLYYYI